jgi:hypothetical protein
MQLESLRGLAYGSTDSSKRLGHPTPNNSLWLDRVPRLTADLVASVRRAD